MYTTPCYPDVGIRHCYICLSVISARRATVKPYGTVNHGTPLSVQCHSIKLAIIPYLLQLRSQVIYPLVGDLGTVQ